MPVKRKMLTFFKKMRDSQEAVALIEFAYMVPILMILGMGGVEIVNIAMVNTRLSQMAIALSDNASRVKANVGGAITIREADINDVFYAVETTGQTIAFKRHGRAILSSLETNASGGQWVRWQRCYGDLSYTPVYGRVDDGKTGTSYAGMGPSDGKVTVEPEEAIMYVEMVYDYQPMWFSGFGPIRMVKNAAFYVRDTRDLSKGVSNPAPAVAAAKIKSCSFPT